jgi:hypothetical protein
MMKTKLKAKQKLRIIRTWGVDGRMMVYCTYGKLHDTLDVRTAGAVEEALKCIVDDRFQYKGIGATFNGISIQVDLLD